MANKSREQLDRLKQIVAEEKLAAERAEARAEEINRIVQSLGGGTVPTRTFTAGHFSQPYDEGNPRTDSGWVVQAAINIPKGLGVISFDTEEYHRYKESDELHELFRSFETCNRAERAFLNTEIPALVEQLEQFVSRWKSTGE